jgi:chemotaxis protein methyltransferase CheR
MRVLRKRFREATTFRVMDVRAQLPRGNPQLVMCRNAAFTYFDVAVQRELLRRLAGRMARGAFVVLGAHEQLPEDDNFTTFSQAIYRRA